MLLLYTWYLMLSVVESCIHKSVWPIQLRFPFCLPVISSYSILFRIMMGGSPSEHPVCFWKRLHWVHSPPVEDYSKGDTTFSLKKLLESRSRSRSTGNQAWSIFHKLFAYCGLRPVESSVVLCHLGASFVQVNHVSPASAVSRSRSIANCSW